MQHAPQAGEAAVNPRVPCSLSEALSRKLSANFGGDGKNWWSRILGTVFEEVVELLEAVDIILSVRGHL
jgi:hypothetical protein